MTAVDTATLGTTPTKDETHIHSGAQRESQSRSEKHLQGRSHPRSHHPRTFAGFLCRRGVSRNEAVDGASDAGPEDCRDHSAGLEERSVFRSRVSEATSSLSAAENEPEAIPREISSRSDRVRTRRDRRRAVGGIPPRGNNNSEWSYVACQRGALSYAASLPPSIASRCRCFQLQIAQTVSLASYKHRLLERADSHQMGLHRPIETTCGYQAFERGWLRTGILLR
jgi:hypothetical protein